MNGMQRRLLRGGIFAVLGLFVSGIFDAATAQATREGAVRYRSFKNTGGSEIYLGKPDLGVAANRIEKNFTWTRPGSYPVTFTYDPSARTLVTNGAFGAMTYNLGTALPDLDSFEIILADRDNNSQVDFNNVVVDGEAIGSFTGDGTSRSFPFYNLNLNDGFTFSGTIVLSGNFGNSQENSKVEIVVGKGIAPPPTPPGPATFDLLPSLVNYAVFSCLELKLSGQALIDSEGVQTGGAHGEEGHSRSNENIRLSGGSTIYGNATPGPGKIVDTQGQGTVTGTRTPATEPLRCDPIDLVGLKNQLLTTNSNATIPLSDRGHSVLSGADGKQFRLNGNDGLTLSAGNYLFSEFDLTGQSTLRLEGQVNILVTGPVKVTGGGLIRQQGSQFSLRLWTTGAVTFSGQTTIQGFVYAPTGNVAINGGAQLFGGVFAKQVDISGGNSKVRRLVDDAAPTLEITAPTEGQNVDCSVTVSGRALDDETGLTLKINGQAVTLAGDGSFSTVVALGGVDPSLIVLEATDISGNIARVERRVVITKPMIALTTPVPGSLLSQRIVNLTGSAGTATSLTADGQATTLAGGTFSLAGFDLGSDGLKTLTLVGSNCGGSTTEVAVLDLDTTPPTIAIDSPTTPTLFGSSPIIVTGTVDDAHLATVTVNGVTATVEGGRFTAANVPLVEGPNNLVAVARDLVNLQTNSAPVTVELDSTAPEVEIDNPVSGALVATPTIPVSGHFEDSNIFEIKVCGVNASISGLNFSVAACPLIEGDNFLIAEARDRAGNQSTSPSVVVVLDTLAPTVAIDAALLPALTAAATVTVEGTVADPHLDRVLVNGVLATVVDNRFVAVDVPLSEGSNSLVATAFDTLGHQATSAAATVVRDATPPEITIIFPAANTELATRTITVSGTVADAHLERVTVLGVVATVAGATWSATVELPEGPSDITAFVVDTLGQGTSATPIPVLVDTLPPIVRLDAPLASLVGVGNVTLTGTFDDVHLREIRVGDLLATVDAVANTFSVTGVALVEGSNSFTATATDTFGNSTTSDAITIVLDTTAPTIAIDTPALVPPATAFLTNDANLAIAGPVADANLDTVLVNGVAATVAAGRFGAIVVLTEGANQVVATATDLVGLATDSAPLAVVLDTQAPVLALDAPAALTAVATLEITGSVSDANLAAVTVNGVAATVTAGRFSALVPLVEGDNAIVASATDALGAIATTPSATVVRDSTAPTVTISAPFDGAVAPGRTIVVRGTALDAHLQTVMVNGVAATLNGAEFVAEVALADGLNVLQAMATDALGQIGSASVSVRLDTQAPALAIQQPAAGACVLAGQPFEISGSFIEPNPSSGQNGAPPPLRLEVVGPDGNRTTYVGSLTADQRFVVTGVAPGTVEGPLAATATAVDATGNSAQTSASWKVDAVAPQIRLLIDGGQNFPALGAGASPPNGTQPTLFGRILAFDVAVGDGLHQPPTATLTLNGAPYQAGTAIAADGDYVLVARATDCAGRTTIVHAFFRIDRTPPRLLATVPADGAALTTVLTSYRGDSDADLASATVNGTAASITGPGLFLVQPFTWSEGQNIAQIELVDRAGNSASYRRTFSVRTVALAVEIVENGLTIPANTLFTRQVVPIVRANDGNAIVTATLNGAPYLSGTPIASSGTYTLSASATDSLGRTATAAATFRVDLGSAPTIRILSPSDNSTLPGPTVAVSGTVSGQNPTVRVNGVVATVSGATFSVAALPLRANDDNEIEAEVVDAAGRRASHRIAVLAIEGGPGVLILDPAEGTITQRDKIDVLGTVLGGAAATADGLVTILSPAGQITTPIGSDGAFHGRDLPLATGTNAIVARAVDASGRAGEANLTIYSDVAPPTITLAANNAPLTDGAVFGGPLTLIVTVSDDSGEVTPPAIRLNGQEQVAGGVTTTLQIQDDGGYLLSVVARDRAQNESRAERSFVIDRGGCALSEIFPADGSGVLADSVTLRGRSGEATIVKVRASGQPDLVAALADGTFLAGGVPLPTVGDNVLQIVCVDAGGQSETLEHTIVRLPASNGPIVDITSPLAGALLGVDRVDVSGTVTPGSGVTINGQRATVTGGTFVASGVALVEGPNILGALALDPSGRIGTDRIVVERDSQAPRLTITSPDNNSVVGVAGSGPAKVDVAGTIDLTVENHLVAIVVTGPQGSVNATIDALSGRFLASNVLLDPQAQADSVQIVRAVATDALGHSSTVQVGVKLNAAGPALILTAPADLERIDENAPATFQVTGEAWAEEGAELAINGSTIDPTTLTWSAPAADGRLHVTFSVALATPSSDTPFGVIARVTEPDGQQAQARRTLLRDSRAPELIEIIPAHDTNNLDPNTLFLILFSEPVRESSLLGPDGLSLQQVAGGTTLVGTVTVAGNAVAFAPASALERGQSYKFRVGRGVKDLVGHALVAAGEVTVHVGAASTQSAPILESLPAILCATEIRLRGQAEPGVRVKALAGDLVFSAFAGADRSFEIRLPIATSGYHVIQVWSEDQNGGVSPKTTAIVRIDCSAPIVAEASFDRSTGILIIDLSEPVQKATAAVGQVGDALELRDAEDPLAPLQSASISWADGDRRLLLTLDGAPTAWWRERPVRLRVGPPLADLEGNAMNSVFETVFFPGATGGLAGGFLFGEVYDDASGRPLEAAAARLFDSGSGLPGTGSAGAAIAAATTEGRGRYTLAGRVPAGRYALLLERAGYTRAVRRLALEPSRGAVPFDARLTPLSPSLGQLDPNGGGRLAGPRAALEAAPAALPGTSPLDLRLTELSGQSLPEFLPLGWTPAVAFDLRLEAGVEALADGHAAAFTNGGVALEMPLPPWVEAADLLFAVQYELASGQWLNLAPPELLGAGRVLVRPVGPGAVAIVVPDLDPATRPELPALVGEALRGVDAGAFTTPTFTATLTLDPPVVPPTGRSLARVVARAVDGVAVWPSGLAVQAFLEERLILAAGAGQLLEAPFSADLLLYHPRLSAAEQGSNAIGSAGAMSFVVSPSPRAAQVLLDVGYENIRIYPFPEEVERGQIVGPTGGTVGTPDEVELIVPEGALSAAVAATVTKLSASELAALAPIAGYQTLAAVRIDLQGRTLTRPATLRFQKPAGAAAAVAGDPRELVAFLENAPSDFRGNFARLVARATRQGAGAAEKIVAGPAESLGLPLEGIVSEGVYLLLSAQAPIGFAHGQVKAANGLMLDGSRVASPGLGTADITGLGGGFAIPVGAGLNRLVNALHPQLEDVGQATIPNLAPGQIVALDVTIAPQPPRVLSVQPADGSVNVPTLPLVSVLFSEALDPTSVIASTLEIELALGDGLPSGLFAQGETRLSDDRLRVEFLTTYPLAPGRRWIARFKGGVRDAQGTFFQGAVPVEWRFTTSTVVAPGGQVRPELFRIEIPVNGRSRVYALPGALPLPAANQPPWAVWPEVVNPGLARDITVDSFSARSDGSFEGVAGHPPSFPVTLDSKVFLTIIDPSGGIAAKFQVGPFVSPDGKAFVAPAGEAVTFTSAEGIVVEVPAAAFDKGTLVKINFKPLSDYRGPLVPGLSIGGYVAIDFEGQAKETLRVHVPAPADAQVGKQVFIGRTVDLSWGKRMQLISYGGVLERDGQRFLSNDPSVQAEPVPNPLRSGAANLTAPITIGKDGPSALISPDEHEGDPPRTCRDVKVRGLGRCFAQSLMMEMTYRSDAVFMYETGVAFALLTGGAGIFPFSFGVMMEAIYNKIADMMVFLPPPMDTRGGFWILPVRLGEAIAMVRRDVASGWILAEQAYDPIDPNAPDLVPVVPLGGAPDEPPMLIGTKPFQFLRFSPPRKGAKDRLRLDIEVETDEQGRVSLQGIPDFPIADHSELSLYDLGPLSSPDPQVAARGPIEGPSQTLCDNGESWSLHAFEPSSDLLLVIGQGDLDPAALSRIELQFDRSLDNVEDSEESEILELIDLGPSGDGCGPDSSSSAYPRTLPVQILQEDDGRRLVIEPLGTIAAGHRFRLSLKRGQLRTAGQSALPYWSQAPQEFEFATKAVEGEEIGSFGGQFPFEGTGGARDLMRFGNLLLVGSEAGKIIAFDTNEVRQDGGFKIHAVKNGFNGSLRTFATDGHNRLFYSALFGPIWAIKTLRAEDARLADEECYELPNWAPGARCFEGLQGSVRVAYHLGTQNGTASEFLAAGAMPSGIPSDLEVLTQDERGKTLDLAAFVDAYANLELTRLTPDDEGLYSVDIELTSTYMRGQSGRVEPSLDQVAGEPAIPDFRTRSCEGEEKYDRYQRATIDNLTTGQSWSVDLENPWPPATDGSGDGDGKEIVKLKARKGDRLRVRYNVRALGYLSIIGSGITVVDLNRFYQVLQPGGPGGSQCGRRLGKFEGATVDFPSCVDDIGAVSNEGLRFTPSVMPQGDTACESGNCTRYPAIDVYSALQKVGAIHTSAAKNDPGFLQYQEMAACIRDVGGQFAFLRDVTLLPDVTWVDRGIRGSYDGTFRFLDEEWEPYETRGDLLFLSMGNAGIFVFDVTNRYIDESVLIGHLYVKDHVALRLEVDRVNARLFAGGSDRSNGQTRPLIDIWEARDVNVAPELKFKPQPRISVHAPWTTNRIAVDSATGLLYSWDPAKGPIVVPLERPRFTFAGLYLPELEEDGGSSDGGGDDDPPLPDNELQPYVTELTSRFVPLGVPMEATLEEEKKRRDRNQRRGTAALKVRVALPGALGDELYARVESLRALPEEKLLDKKDLGPAVALPGGEGWPETSVYVKLRRVGQDINENSAGATTENGQFATVYNLYESEETVLLMSDPRAKASYHRQDFEDSAPKGKEADEEAQCRRCRWPLYLPDPETSHGEVEGIKELLTGGRFIRAILAENPTGTPAINQKTEDALDFFERQESNYQAPIGWANIVAPATFVPSPIQASQAEPAQNPGIWNPGEANIAVTLVGGEAIFHQIDHQTQGRGVPFSFERTYRSGALGYGPLGGAAWSSNFFAHLREIETTGEVEYYDGAGNVWRFLPAQEQLPAGYERDPAGSYDVPQGFYMRLQKFEGGGGWRLLGREHDSLRFDAHGRLVEMSDRHRQASEPSEQGNTLQLRYDGFGQLVEVTDDLGRSFRFEYRDDPRPTHEGGDGDRFGLLEKIEDFFERTVEFEYDDERRLTKVKLAEIKNPTSEYAGEFSFEGANRPTIEYEYDDPGLGNDARLHGELGRYLLKRYFLPKFADVRSPRFELDYEAATGRVDEVTFPDGNGLTTAHWKIRPGVGNEPLPKEVEIEAPWQHKLTNTLENGRVVSQSELLEVARLNGTSEETVERATTFAEDGRALTETAPDGGQKIYCYQDGVGCEGQEKSEIDRLALLNLAKTTHLATNQEGRGLATYDRIESGAGYDSDNQMRSIIDGLDRETGLAVPTIDGIGGLSFSDGVSADYRYDKFGRVESMSSGGTQVEYDFDEDAKGNAKAGLVKKITQGDITREFEYDDQYNIIEERNSHGNITRRKFDSWDRPVRTVNGISEGQFRSVGAAVCDDETGAVVEQAFDAAGHLVRERRLQDHVVDGQTIGCRWFETRYEYNAREQLVSVELTQLASATTPGQIDGAPQRVTTKTYDSYGRMIQEVAHAKASVPVVTSYRYDLAGRLVGTRVGSTAEQVQGFDKNGRVARTFDGDQSIWFGRFDVWDHLYQEVHPTGALVMRTFDQAGNPTLERTWDNDPLVPNSTAKLLSETRAETTSFGEISRLIEVLDKNEEGDETLFITEQDFDQAGRVIGVWSGPPVTGALTLDRSQARREVERTFELEGGRILSESSGGLAGEPPLLITNYVYGGESKAPWPDAIKTFEAVPGEAAPVETATTTFVRDALGRAVIESSTDGRVVRTTYDRSGGPIQVRTGSDMVISQMLDGRGLLVRQIRPLERGDTAYTYDLDGRPLLEQARSTDQAEPWSTGYNYDGNGRLLGIRNADGTLEAFSYNPDNTLATSTTRDNVTIAFSYDAANRLTGAVPSANTTLAPSLAPLDAGDTFSYDILSRPTEVRRGRSGLAGHDPKLAVKLSGYDLGSRPTQEQVGNRSPMGWTWDVWSRPIETRLPSGIGSVAGYRTSFDTFDRQEGIQPLAGAAVAHAGANWSWGGNRLFAMDTRAPLGTALRLGYQGGRGPQANSDSAKWQLATVTWGAGSLGAMVAPAQVYGQFAFGFRGNDGAPSDGVKLGREALQGSGLDLFAGLGWSYNYDAGVRLVGATPGRGSQTGQADAQPDERFRYEYGEGDELEKIIREAAGQIAELEVGVQGRITARNGQPFNYDLVGRRTEDDRFVYVWDWRGELHSVTVKENWPDGVVSPFAGHKVRYLYDATGRLSERQHLGGLPTGVTDETQRLLLETRTYTWNGDGLLAEEAFSDAALTQLLWRKTYVPGPGGYDDNVQVMVEKPGQGIKLYTYLRDELGTVIGLVAEDESQDPARPSVPVRYAYSPYGEAHVELGPELRTARFDNGMTSAGSGSQEVSDEQVAAKGGVRLRFSLELDPDSVANALIVERQAGSGWQELATNEVAIGLGGGERTEIQVLALAGWQRNAAYRIRLGATLTDRFGRAMADRPLLEWSVPAGATSSVAYEQVFRPSFENFESALNPLSGRFPGGQSHLFQGLWTDPVTGMAYARARWYDARNATWLSEDPALDVDSPNRYAFVGWQPHMSTDPQGLCAGGFAQRAFGWGCAEGQDDAGVVGGFAKGVWNGVVGTVQAIVEVAPKLLSEEGRTELLDGARKAAYECMVRCDELIANAYKEFKDASPEKKAEILGELLSDTVVGVATGGAGAAVSKGAKFAKWASKAVKTGQKVDRMFPDKAPRPHHTPDIETGRSSDRMPERRADPADGPAPTCGCPGACGTCFTAETLILTEAGAKAINEIAIGDKVWATNLETNEQELADVVQLFERVAPETWILTLESGAQLETTDEHPFYVEGQGFTETKLLKVGDLLRSFDGELVALTGIEIKVAPQTVYNFEVADRHNYHVGVEQVLVHNCNGLVASYGKKKKELKGTGEQAHHLNQDAAFGSIIPHNQGAAIGMKGNAFVDGGTPHYEVHKGLETFWNRYRANGRFEGSKPTVAEYSRALKASLRRAGFTKARINYLVAEARKNRLAFGIQDTDIVPRVPGRINQR